MQTVLFPLNFALLKVLNAFLRFCYLLQFDTNLRHRRCQGQSSAKLWGRCFCASHGVEEASYSFGGLSLSTLLPRWLQVSWSLSHYIHQNQPPVVCCTHCYSCPILCDPSWTVAHQAHSVHKFLKQEYWRGYHFFLQDLPDRRTRTTSPALQMDSLPPSHLEAPASL